MEFTLPENWRKGLGTELMVFSVLMDFNVTQLNINRHLQNYNFEKYKKIFQIENFTVNQVEPSKLTNAVEPHDLFKVFSPYYKLPLVRRIKPFIGLCSYPDTTVLSGDTLDYPNCKVYSIDQYAELYKFIKLAGYEVISLDARRVAIEDKAEFIRNHCACIIGYEGGIAHLSHMLSVPYIMLPWRTDFDAKLLHLDSRTYFLDSIEQILSWSPDDLNNIINQLHNEKTNNELVHDPSLIFNRLPGHEITQIEKDFLRTKYTI